jgi:hypothetical protein
MKEFFRLILLTTGIVGGVIGIAYYTFMAFMQIDFIGQKDPKIVEENLKRWKNTLLSAEYRNGTDYCELDLLDSVNIEINVGDKTGGVILNEEYKILNDTIVVIGGITNANKYLTSDKFLIKEKKLLFKIDSHGIFDTLTAMNIKFNKFKIE